MTTRKELVAKAVSYDGVNNGTGYPGPLNVFEEELGRPQEFWCGDFVTAIFKMCGIPLPSMQDGLSTGFDNCPDAMEYAINRPLTWTRSWFSLPGDIVIFGLGSQIAQHTGIVASYNPRTGALYTAEGDSAGSDIPGNPYTGEGGVHLHVWAAPLSVGNDNILGIISTGRLVHFDK